MQLQDLGYNAQIEKWATEYNTENFELARVITEHKERYIVKTTEGEYESEITGNLRYTAQGREDFPAVGDWVTISVFDKNSAIIHKVLPRFSIIKRQAVGSSHDIQIIATNIDYGFLVQAVDRDFNINRLERYLTICYSSKVEPIIVLTKTDLIAEQEVQEIKDKIKQRIKDVVIIAISSETLSGYEKIKQVIQAGKTYCLLGSSGVGKSTLINRLSGKDLMVTNNISVSTNKGRHVTTHRELIILENGEILIDNPGMREVGIADEAEGLETTFDRIIELSKHCKYSDCTHTSESGCSVLEALEKGEISQESYNNYLRLEREKEHYESTQAERRKKDKDFGKMIKNYKKSNKKGD